MRHEEAETRQPVLVRDEKGHLKINDKLMPPRPDGEGWKLLAVIQVGEGTYGQIVGFWVREHWS